LRLRQGRDVAIAELSRSDTVAAKISSAFSLTGYLPLSSSGHLPTLSMRWPDATSPLACIAHATPINAPAT
jgi:hypothetical protein